MKLLSFSLSKEKEFSIIGIANIYTKKVKFQGLINDVPFIEDEDYEIVREFVMEAIQVNKPETHENVV